MKKQVEAWKATRILDEAAKLVIYRAFVEGELDVPKHLARRVHDLYFNPHVEEFAPRTTLSLSQGIHKRVQGARPDSPVQGHRQDGGIQSEIASTWVHEISPALHLKITELD